MQFGKAIKQLRKEKGLSQVELSQTIGLSQTAISQIESGVHRPAEETINLIAFALNIPPAAIYITALDYETGEDVPANKKETWDIIFPIIKNLLKQLIK